MPYFGDVTNFLWIEGNIETSVHLHRQTPNGKDWSQQSREYWGWGWKQRFWKLLAGQSSSCKVTPH